MTETTTAPHIVAATDESDDRAAWMDARADHRVTASEVHSIAVGGRSTWLRILEGKLNGSRFTGNAQTKRGHRREPYLIEFANEFIHPGITANARLLVHAENNSIGATPDGLGDGFGVEVKSHDHGWNRDDAPQEHIDQMQLGMYVTGFDRWLYVWETMDEDGEPTLDEPRHLWIERDERRIAYLVREAERFLSWWDADAPASDDLPAEIDDALAAWADARARKKDAEADEKAAEKIIRAHIAKTEGAERDGLKLAGRAAQLVYSVTEKEALDTDAWAEAEPHTYAAWNDLTARADEAAKAAATLYHRRAVSTRLNITPTKDSA